MPQQKISDIRGLLTFHRHTSDPSKVWTVERGEGYGHKKPFAVRFYVHDVLATEERFAEENEARSEFERRVSAAYPDFISRKKAVNA